MTPSSTLLKRALKKQPLNQPASDDSLVINLQRSRTHQRVLAGITLLCLSTPIQAQLPLIAVGFIGCWTLACAAQLYRNPSTLQALHDKGDSWQLVYPDRTVTVQYEHSHWCNAYLILMGFKDESGKAYRIGVWRDSVTDSSFSYLAARVTLGSASKR